MEKEDIKQEEQKKGRQLILDAYKSQNPETEDPDDEVLHDFSHKRYSDLEGKYNEFEGANKKLSELISKDPRFGAFLSMIAGENSKSVPYAFSSVFGKDAMGLEGKDLDDYETGYKEYSDRKAKEDADQKLGSENFNKTLANLHKYISDKKLDEEKGQALYDGIMDLGESFLMGIVPNEIFDLVYKGLNYDADVQEAADTGFVEGKNTSIEKKINSKAGGSEVPNFNNSTGMGKKSPILPKNNDEIIRAKPIPGTAPNLNRNRI